MSSFKDQTWDEREKKLGDPAEDAFRQWAGRQGLAYVKYGLDRPPIDMGALPPYIRYTPDFLLDLYGLIEVQGCGRDGLFKFKHEKLNALTDWRYQAPVYLWLWHQPTDQYVIQHVDKIAGRCYSKGGLRTDGMFDGTKPYAHVSWETLTGSA